MQYVLLLIKNNIYFIFKGGEIMKTKNKLLLIIGLLILGKMLIYILYNISDFLKETTKTSFVLFSIIFIILIIYMYKKYNKPICEKELHSDLKLYKNDLQSKINLLTLIFIIIFTVLLYIHPLLLIIGAVLSLLLILGLICCYY